jgi:hypothetical protein
LSSYKTPTFVKIKNIYLKKKNGFFETAPNVISKIKQNSSDMNEIILAPCDAGYVQSCTGFF